MGTHDPHDRWDDRPASELDDREDREVLRERYYGLLHELRILLPGVQLLLAFLLTVPFDAAFGRLDTVERAAYGVSLGSSMAATVSFVSPTSFHRLADRRARSQRLVWAIRCMVLGLVFLAVALIAGLLCVSRFVYGNTFGWCATAVLTSMIASLWILVPWSHRRSDEASDPAGD